MTNSEDSESYDEFKSNKNKGIMTRKQKVRWFLRSLYVVFIAIIFLFLFFYYMRLF